MLVSGHKMISILDYVFVYQFSVSRISSVRVKLKFDFSFKSVLRFKRRIVCFGMNFKSIIWFLVKLCLSAREYTENAKTKVFVNICSIAVLSANNTSTHVSMYSTVH